MAMPGAASGTRGGPPIDFDVPPVAAVPFPWERRDSPIGTGAR